MVEYILPIAMVCILVGTFSMSGSFFDSFQSRLKNQTKGTLSDQDLTVKKFGVLDQSLIPVEQEVAPDPGAGGASPQAPTETVCFGGDIACLTIPVIGESSETSGGLGGGEVESLTAILEQLPKILEELGVEPSVIDQVTKLANMGHGLADKLKAIEGVCKPGKVCTGTESAKAKKELLALKKGELGDFLKQYNDLNAYLKTNPNALAAFPEAANIIKNKVNEIKTILNNLSAQNSYKNVVKPTPQLVHVGAAGKYGAIPCTNAMYGGVIQNGQCYVRKTVNTAVPVFQGLNFNSPGVKKVHQNANTICNNGGNNCVRKS